MERFTVTPPPQLISTAEGKLHCKVDFSADDSTIDKCCRMAQDFIQAKTGQRVGEQVVNLSFDSFYADEIALDFGPIIDIVSVDYLDEDGVEQTVDPSVYRFIRGFRSYVSLRPLQSWPATYAMRQSVTIQVKCGWKIGAVPAAGEEELPGDLVKLMYLLVNHFYENRELVHTGLQLREMPAHLDVPGICASHERPNI